MSLSDLSGVEILRRFFVAFAQQNPSDLNNAEGADMAMAMLVARFGSYENVGGLEGLSVGASCVGN